MTADLPRYPEYRRSGVPWLEEVPEHWEVRRIKTMFREKDHRSGDGAGVLLSLTRARGIVPQADASNRMASAENLSKYKVCRPGDLVMNRMQAWSGMFALSPSEGLVSPDYSVFEARGTSEVKYFEHLFKTPLLVDEFARRSKGIGSGFNRLYTPDFGAVPVSVPPLHEQAGIARFLDHADRRIRRYIRTKQKLIELLNEQEQAIVHRTVTRGLDPDVALTDSGVSWLGNVPRHWEVLPLRRRWTVTDCKHLTVPFVSDGIPLASVREVQFFDLDLSRAKRTTSDWHQSLIEGGRRPHQGDLIYCRNASVGAAAFVNTDAPFAMGQDVCLIRSPLQNQRYLNYFLHSPAMHQQLATLLVGSTFSRINVAEIKSLLVAVPPRSEQDAIADHLDAALGSCELLIANARTHVARIREFRTRLVADVVTGKVDVREAAARLPEEVATPDGLDDADTLVEGEDATDGDPDAMLDEVLA